MSKQTIAASILTTIIFVVIMATVLAGCPAEAEEKSALDQLRDAGPGFYLFIRGDDGRTLSGRITVWTGEIHTVPVEQKEPETERAGGEV